MIPAYGFYSTEKQMWLCVFDLDTATKVLPSGRPVAICAWAMSKWDMGRQEHMSTEDRMSIFMQSTLNTSWYYPIVDAGKAVFCVPQALDGIELVPPPASVYRRRFQTNVKAPADWFEIEAAVLGTCYEDGHGNVSFYTGREVLDAWDGMGFVRLPDNWRGHERD